MEFVTSDLHFNHNKNFIYAPRGFNSIGEHDYEIIKRWNETVGVYDRVWFLGDIGMGTDIEYLKNCVSRLNGEIHWIRGNHDSDKRYSEIGFYGEIIPEEWAQLFKWKGQRFWLSHFPTMTAPIDAKPFYTSTISLCGHTHTQNRWSDWNDYMIYHVELDAHNCVPVSFEEIIDDIRTKCR